MKIKSKHYHFFQCILLACLFVIQAGCKGNAPKVDESAAATQAAVQSTAAFAAALTSIAAPVDAGAELTAPQSEAATPVPEAMSNYTWSSQIVDDDGDVGVYPSLVLDQNNSPRIAYLDDGEDNTKYAFVSDGAWTVQSLDSPNVDGHFPSLVLDGSGNPYICRFVINVSLISCTYYVDKTWQVMPFINAVKAADVEMVMSSTGEQQVVLYDTNDSNVKYYRMVNGAWSSLIMDNVTAEGETFPFVLGPNNQPHIAYYAAGQGLKHITTRDGANWETTFVEAAIGLYPDMAIDPYGNPHIAYYDQNLKALKHAAWDGAVWNIDLVDDEGEDVGWHPSIAIGQNGAVHISYYDHAAGLLKYAYGLNRQFDIYMVDNTEGSAGKYSSIVVDPAGNPHIAYYCHEEARLKYAMASPQ